MDKIAVLQEFQKKVVDLSRRNRLLKYPKKARSLAFQMSLQEFQDTFGLINEFSVDFIHKAILQKEKVVQGALFDSESTLDDELPYIPPTIPSGEKLLSSLQSFRLDAKRKVEEHGIHTSFLTVGTVSWKQPLAGRGSSDATNASADYEAPILLVPVDIKDVKNPKRTTITSYTDIGDIVVNPVLLLLMELDYGVKVAEIEGDFSDLPAYFLHVRNRLSNGFKEANINCSITEDIRIGQYSFYGQQIYEDLKDNQSSFVEHEFISSLCGNEQLAQGGMGSDFEPENFLTKEEDYNVLDADVSQVKVIQQIISGKNLIVQGPPGTGKSQTIVNAVSNLLARGKTVLVVCEKQVALDVVFQRLKNVGLERLCLPLFHHSSDKKQFAKMIIGDRDYLTRNYSDKVSVEIDSSLRNRDASMKRLYAYASALGTVVSPLEKTVHWVHGELSKAQSILGGVGTPWREGNPLEISYEGYQEVTSVLQSLTPALIITSQKRFSHWKNIRKIHFSPDFAGRVQFELRKLDSIALECASHAEALYVLQSFADVKYCMSLEGKFGDILNLSSLSLPVNMEADIRSSAAIVKSITELVSEYQEFIEAQCKAKKVGTSKQYRIPSEQGFSLEGNLGVIKKDSSVSKCREAYEQFAIVEDAIAFIQKESLALGETLFLEIPIAEVVRNNDIFFANPIVQRIANWREIVSLKLALDRLAPLHGIHAKISDAKKTINSWAILASGIDAAETSEIAERFKNYGNGFLRLFSLQYRKDCKVIESWCNINAPKRYEEFLEIIQAIGSLKQLEEKLGLLLNEFAKDIMVSDAMIDIEEIPILYSQIDKLVDWLYKEGQQEIPVRVAKIMERNIDVHSMKTMSSAFAGIQDVIDGSWGVFSIDSELLSVGKLSEFQKDFHLITRSISTLSENIKQYISVGNEAETISELQSDADMLNRLYVFSEQMTTLFPEKVFALHGSDSHCLFDNPKELTVVYDALTSMVALVDGLNGFSGTELSVGDVYWFVSKMSKNKVELEKCLQNYADAMNEMNGLFESKSSVEHLEPVTFSEFRERMGEMISDTEGLEGWMQYRKYTHQLTEMGYGWFLDAMHSNLSQPMRPDALFSQSLWSAWLDSYYGQNPVLREFSVNEHLQLIESFRRFEKDVLKVNPERILRRNIPSINKAKANGGEEERFLLRQSQMKKAHKPIRQVVTQCSSHLQEYKPCWMMSPLTLSSYIPYGKVSFDVVIFDEASQMRVEHALSSIARAKQVVIFGDEHQLPPTSFFQMSGDGDDEADDSQDFESILHASKTILPAADVSLLYHYRSRFEDLIAFSNHHIYNDELITFPNPGGANGVVFEYVPDGVFDGGKDSKRSNVKEAERVVDICIKHVTDFPNKSIGVIAFSRSQEVAIRDAMIQRLKDNPFPELLERLDENGDEADAFFIKNLESVQGDERDIVVLSIGYGRNKDGKIYNRFGPINGSYGYRRLNVAITRAKEKVICVSSMKAYDINPSETSRGAKMLQNYLDYAENGVQTLTASRLRENNRPDVEPDSEFELDVQNALIGRGYAVDRQVGASGFRIDLAVLNPVNHKEYLLGIECDGASYHSSYSARINDKLRQEILEGLGWKMYRVWSQHWISHKEAIVDDIIRAIS